MLEVERLLSPPAAAGESLRSWTFASLFQLLRTRSCLKSNLADKLDQQHPKAA
jgi:hypothetical protein